MLGVKDTEINKMVKNSNDEISSFSLIILANLKRLTAASVGKDAGKRQLLDNADGHRNEDSYTGEQSVSVH